MKTSTTFKQTENQLINDDNIAVAFYRVSTDKQNNDRQIEDVRRYCQAYFIKLTEDTEFKEIMSGAAKIEERADLQKMLKYVDENKTKIKYVIVSELSRLARSQDAVTIIRNLTENKICFISLKENIKTIDDEGKVSAMTTLLLQIMSAINEFELTTITYRVKSGLKKTVQNGTFHGGSPSFGYNKIGKEKTARLIINENEAKIVKKIYKLYLEGNSTYKIANILILQGSTTKNGKKWKEQYVYNVLTNQIYSGKRKWKDIIIDVQDSKIIEPAQFNIVQDRLKIKANTSDLSLQKKYEYLLSGKIYCTCGQHCIGQKRSNTYMCKSKKYAGGCATKSIKIDFLENEIKSKLIENESKLIFDNTLIISKITDLKNELYNLNSIYESEKRKQNRLAAKFGEKEDSLLERKYDESKLYTERIFKKIEELEKKLELAKQSETIFINTKFHKPDGKSVNIKIKPRGNFNTKYEKTEIIIDKEVMQKVIEKITIDNEKAVVNLVNSNSFIINRT